MSMRSMTKIVMRTRYDDFEIELNDSDTANALFLALPLEREINVWGGEIYFEVPVDMPLQHGRKVMQKGEVAYWPEGSAFCIFFGPTPVSQGSEPEAYTPVTPLGMITTNVGRLEQLPDRCVVVLEVL
jgi:hypothetical protein